MKINEITAIQPGDWSQDDVDSEADTIRKETNKKSKKGVFGKYNLVPVTGLPEGFYLAYKKSKEGYSYWQKDRFTVVLVDTRENPEKPQVVSYMWFEPENVYFGEPNYSSMQGLKVRLLGTNSKYAGHGYAVQVYKMLVNHGQILFSDTSQTPDGTKLWAKLLSSDDMSGWAMIVDNESTSTISLEKAYPISANNFDFAKKEVFANYNNQFALIPKNDTQTIELLKTKIPEWMKKNMG